ncbi:MAG: hypothetical protein JWQ10_2227 [Herbaspirillum sp.]|nr:hypothetical protein [Herbaspirillum sp.]
MTERRRRLAINNKKRSLYKGCVNFVYKHKNVYFRTEYRHPYPKN